MIHIKTYEALTIKQYRPYHKEATKVNYEERYKDIFQKYEGGRNSFRIYLPLIKTEKSKIQEDVESILNQIGIDTTNPETFDYVSGMAKYSGAKNWTKIGKILMKNPEWKDIYQKFQNDATRSLKNKDLEVCISRHPYDIVGADTDRAWINCMTLTHYNRLKKEWYAKGQSVEHLKYDVRQGSLVAFLINKNDRNIQNPFANISIKPYLNEENSKDVVLVPDNRMYGTWNLDFSITVFAWCDEINGDKIGHYKIAKGLHMDNFKRDKGMLGAEVKGREDIEEFERDDPRSNYARKYLPKNEEYHSNKLLKKTLNILNMRFNNGDFVKVKKSTDLNPKIKQSVINDIYEIDMIDTHDSTYLVKSLTKKKVDDTFNLWLEDKDLRRATQVEVAALKYNL